MSDLVTTCFNSAMSRARPQSRWRTLVGFFSRSSSFQVPLRHVLFAVLSIPFLSAFSAEEHICSVPSRWSLLSICCQDIQAHPPSLEMWRTMPEESPLVKLFWMPSVLFDQSFHRIFNREELKMARSSATWMNNEP
ncbi:hypothetical protein K402DRAFT_186003 [Aulographum hederae CBS 113979]|uniref:Uncharacterized protein n=1 Tax=Aulographum hederae CBS 113979 TaxID=1176131 RepID=A0A6G1GPE9_9PEZI|nr:hypothetical protein K402DRAFT_186003 [Aulographum hederae CBS 113979]